MSMPGKREPADRSQPARPPRGQASRAKPPARRVAPPAEHAGQELARTPTRYFAVLATAKPPATRVRLVGHIDTATALDVEFEPLQYSAETQIQLGAVIPRGGALGTLLTAQVQRGRNGHKASELLCVLKPIAEDAERWPRARWAGVLKGALKAMGELTAGRTEPAPLLWWLGLEFALRGYAETEQYVKHAHELGLSVKAAPAGAEQVGRLLAWSDYISRQSEELERRVRAKQQRNPLISSVSRDQAQRWLGLQSSELTGRIMRHFCERARLKPGRSLLGPVIALGHEREPLAPGEKQALHNILRAVEEDKLTSVNELRSAFPSQLHIVTFLLDAEMLLECGSYLFTRHALLQALELLKDKRTDIAAAGVRDIKDLLGYSRRKAEALRAFIVAHFGEPKPVPPRSRQEQR